MDIMFVSLIESHDLFEKWIQSCNEKRQLALFTEVVQDYFTTSRFKIENYNAVFLAKVSLLNSIATKLKHIEIPGE